MTAPAPFILALLAACSSEDLPPAARPPTPTPVGVPSGEKTSAVFGAAGGTLVSGDGRVALRVPPGALAVETEIGVQPITNTAPLGIGTAYRFTPDGARFAVPLTLSFRYEDADTDGSSPEALHVVYQTPQGFWQVLGPPSVDQGARVVTVATDHFTDMSKKVPDWRLRPPRAVVKKGESVVLELKLCLPDGSGRSECDGELSGLPYRMAKIWRINGKNPPDLTDGSIAPAGMSATYTAPHNIPRRNPVAVSVEWKDAEGWTVIAVANVRVTGEVPAWVGTITTDETVTIGGGSFTETIRANVRFTQSDEQMTPGAIRYEPEGTVSYELRGVYPDCMTTVGPQVVTISPARGLPPGELVVSTLTEPSGYSGNGLQWLVPPLDGKTTCNDARRVDVIKNALDAIPWWTTGSSRYQLKENGTVMEETVTKAVGGGRSVIKWRLEAQP